MHKTLLAVALSAGLIGGAQAEGDIGLSAALETTGLGAELTQAINQDLSLRVGYKAFSRSWDTTEDGLRLDGDIKVGGFNALLDYHPFSNGFKLSAGIYVPRNKVSADGQFSQGGTIEINGVTYSSADVQGVSASAKWNKVSPYIGIGYSGFARTESGFFFDGEVGVMYTGKAKTELAANCVSGSLVCDQLAGDIAAQKAKFDDDVGKVKWYPVVKVAVGYRF